MGTTRSEGRAEELRRRGIEARTLELARGAKQDVFDESFDAVVYAVAPGRGGDDRLAYADGVEVVLRSWRVARPRHFVLVSSTGVYGQTDGSWVDEASATRGDSERARYLLEGEALVAESEAREGPRGVVLRLAGIYGPGRSPLEWCREEGWRSRLAARPAGAYMNWVHVDDAVEAIVLALGTERARGTYLIVDDEPVRRGEFYAFACQCAGLPALEFREGDGAERDAAAGDAQDRGKRCSNRKAKAEIGFRLRYPSYREGLRAFAE